MRRIVEKYNIGMVAGSDDPETLAGIIMDMMQDEEKRIMWKKNLNAAAGELCWENEKEKLLEIYRSAGLLSGNNSVRK
jgi:hypothetical protein